jgi:HAD superfamily hydrolase (TIGR01450 family)
LLIDLDGVLYVGSQVIAGAREALRQLNDDDMPVRFLTNTTTKTAAEVASKLDSLGFDINPGDIFSAVTATREYLIQHAPDGTRPSLYLLVRQSVMAEFAGFPHASLETGEGAPD